ncbi:MAG: hypothetical protein MUF62_00010 [Chitinophagaceae bacterium]|nr:hypothetical protein [Chitinophagaceae bacterium]
MMAFFYWQAVMQDPLAATNVCAHQKNQEQTMEKFFDRRQLVKYGFALLLLAMGLLIGAGFAKSARHWQQSHMQPTLAASALSC